MFFYLKYYVFAEKENLEIKNLIKASDSGGSTPLHWAAYSNAEDILLYLIHLNIFNDENERQEFINKKDCDIKLRLMDKVIYLSCIVGCLIYIIFFIPLKDGVEIKEFADYLDENASHDIKLFTGYNDGAYMEYRGYKCYIDPRAEVFLKNNNHVEDIINEYYDLETS